jgi:hypothetical protein
MGTNKENDLGKLQGDQDYIYKRVLKIWLKIKSLLKWIKRKH